AYIIYRNTPGVSEAFAAASNTLNVPLGLINTAVLICSSLTMALAVYYAQTGVRRNQIIFLLLTIVLGTAFLVIKGFEYADKIKHHHIPGKQFEFAEPYQRSAQIFFTMYFAMTGLHALHMI